jgi:hypothetical protein
VVTLTGGVAPDRNGPFNRSALLATCTDQIRTRDRVRDLAEVYTHEREVKAMLDLVPNMFPTEDDPDNHDRTFLEPACGSGNFLEEILRRKLRTVTVKLYGHGERYEHRVLRCLASIYGIDIDQENVLAARDRLRAVVSAHFDGDSDAQPPTAGLSTAVEAIVNTNIIRADTLADARKIELIAYRPGHGCTFTREWSSLQEPEAQLDLFDMTPGEPQKDEVPVHYADLAANPKPTVVARRRR